MIKLKFLINFMYVSNRGSTDSINFPSNCSKLYRKLITSSWMLIDAHNFEF